VCAWASGHIHHDRKAAHADDAVLLWCRQCSECTGSTMQSCPNPLMSVSGICTDVSEHLAPRFACPMRTSFAPLASASGHIILELIGPVWSVCVKTCAAAYLHAYMSHEYLWVMTFHSVHSCAHDQAVGAHVCVTD
jgi:hypothetical protein